jgi:hypothetical protein
MDPRPSPLPPSHDSKLDRRHIERQRKRGNLLRGEGGRGRAWSRIIRKQIILALLNHSILSEGNCCDFKRPNNKINNCPEPRLKLSQKHAYNNRQITNNVQWKHQLTLTKSNEGKYYLVIKQGEVEKTKRYPEGWGK